MYPKSTKRYDPADNGSSTQTARRTAEPLTPVTSSGILASTGVSPRRSPVAVNTSPSCDPVRGSHNADQVLASGDFATTEGPEENSVNRTSSLCADEQVSGGFPVVCELPLPVSQLVSAKQAKGGLPQPQQLRKGSSTPGSSANRHARTASNSFTARDASSTGLPPSHHANSTGSFDDRVRHAPVTPRGASSSVIGGGYATPTNPGSGTLHERPSGTRAAQQFYAEPRATPHTHPSLPPPVPSYHRDEDYGQSGYGGANNSIHSNSMDYHDGSSYPTTPGCSHGQQQSMHSYHDYQQQQGYRLQDSGYLQQQQRQSNTSGGYNQQGYGSYANMHADASNNFSQSEGTAEREWSTYPSGDYNYHGPPSPQQGYGPPPPPQPPQQLLYPPLPQQYELQPRSVQPPHQVNPSSGPYPPQPNLTNIPPEQQQYEQQQQPVDDGDDVRRAVPQEVDARYRHLFEEFNKVNRTKSRLLQENEQVKREAQNFATELWYYRTKVSESEKNRKDLLGAYEHDIRVLLTIVNGLLAHQHPTQDTPPQKTHEDRQRAKLSLLERVMREEVEEHTALSPHWLCKVLRLRFMDEGVHAVAQPPMQGLPATMPAVTPTALEMSEHRNGNPNPAPTTSCASESYQNLPSFEDTTTAVLRQGEVEGLATTAYKEVRSLLTSMDFGSTGSNAVSSSPRYSPFSPVGPTSAVQLTIEVPPATLHAETSARLLSHHHRRQRQQNHGDGSRASFALSGSQQLSPSQQQEQQQQAATSTAVVRDGVPATMSHVPEEEGGVAGSSGRPTTTPQTQGTKATAAAVSAKTAKAAAPPKKMKSAKSHGAPDTPS